MPNFLVTSCLASALLLFGGCRRREASAAPNAPVESKARAVRVISAAERDVEHGIIANGILVAHDQAALSVKVAGRLEDIPVDVGTVVKQGETIAQIQRRDWELKVQQAKAAVAQARARLGLPLEGLDDSIEIKDTSGVKEARAQLEEQQKNRDRIAKLNEQKILSQSELETAEAAYQVAINKYEDALQETNTRKAMLAQRRAELNIAEQQLSDTQIRAPFNGVVQERKASPGEYLMEGAILASVVRVDPIRLRLEVPEREAVTVRQGQRVNFRVDGDTNVYHGKIDRLSPAIAQDNRMLQLEADIANDGRLRPGAFVRAEIFTTTAPAIMLPRNAVVSFAGIEKVFLFENGKAAERRVTTGRVLGNEIEVIKGIKPGESVIIDPGSMRAGQPLTVGREATERAEAATNG